MKSRGPLGGRALETTVKTSRKQTSRTTQIIVENIKGSGNGNRKGDKEILQALLCEEKTVTRGHSITLRRDVLEKICMEAMEAGKIPMLIASFEAGDWPKNVPRDWAIIPLKKVPFVEISKVGGFKSAR